MGAASPSKPSIWQNLKTYSETTPTFDGLALGISLNIANDAYITGKNYQQGHTGWLTDLYGNSVGADDRLRSGMNTFQLAMAPTGFVNAGGIAIGENITQIETKELSELNPTHYLTRSRSQMQNLVDDIRVNGIKDPLEYVEFNGKNFVVGGNHRYFAAQRLGIGNVPVKQVDLPFAGYNSTQDLMLEGRMPGYWKFIK